METNNEFIVFAIVPVVFIAIILLLVLLINGIGSFMEERRYIKMEMGRSSEQDYEYWKKELKKLYIRSIPVLAPILRRFFK